MLKLFNGFLAIGLVNPHGSAGAHSIRVQKDHDIPNDLLFLPGILDQFSAPRPNALDGFQAGRGMLDDVEYLIAKFLHHFLGIDRPNALDHSTGKVFLNTFPVGGWRAHQSIGPELHAMVSIALPRTFGLNPFTRIGGNHFTENRQKSLPPLGLHAQNHKARVFVEESHTLNQAR